MIISNIEDMKEITVEDLERDFEYYLDRVQEGHCFIIVHNGRRVVLSPP